MNFKNHIQGLRAVSILSVLIYHLEVSFLNSQFFSGGFLGVDIFFVISGYLISSIIINELKNNTFSFYNFYLKRAKRLLPALFVLILFTLLLSILSLDLKSYSEFIDTVFSSGLFYSNFLFWTENAYSAEPSRLKFLLHTWSLSIEEQFYIFFPLFLFIFYSKENLNKLVIFVFLTSIIIATIFSKLYPSANFFLMPTRIWEFFLGTIAFLYQRNLAEKINKLNKYLFDVCFLILLLFLLFYKIDFYHPSIITLIPTLIIFIFIINENQNTIIFKVLSSKTFVFIGNISYSLYLWHFPILVLLRYYSLENSFLYVSLSILIIFFLSLISYKYIENSLRKSSDKKFYLFMTLIVFLIISILFVFSKKIETDKFFVNGKSFNIKIEKEKRWANYKQFCINDICSFNENIQSEKAIKKILFVGDSLVPDAINLMRFSENDKIIFTESTLGGCPPIKNENDIPTFVPSRDGCIKLNKLRYDPNNYKDIEVVIINNLIGWYKINELEKYLNFLNKIKIKKIIVIGNYIVLNKDILKTFTVKDSYFKSYDFKAKFEIQNKLLFDQELKQKSEELNFLYISFKELCQDKECELFDNDGFPFTLDSFHLTYQFAQYASKKLGIREVILQNINN